MYYILTWITGIIVASMIVLNGTLTAAFGAYSATILIHLIGLVLITGIVVWKRSDLRLPKELPFLYFLGGSIGVFTTVANNVSYQSMGVSAILGIGLLGQSVASVLIDQFGWFGMKRRSFARKKLIGFAFTGAGILILIFL
ncbi:MAG: bacterial/archaeal transporter family-2 protein [Clostridiales bacterium]|nr:bacterial/archaeal transporter family-2 protein [Clostridiales bacterium]